MAVFSGIDVIEIERVKKALSRSAGMREFVFTPSEIAYCSGKRAPYKHFAGRFAAKEAVMKALRNGWGQNGLAWKDIEICTEGSSGRPVVRLSNAALSIASDSKVHVSITYTTKRAFATALLENV